MEKIRLIESLDETEKKSIYNYCGFADCKEKIKG
jgi:hypothetical protein